MKRLFCLTIAASLLGPVPTAQAKPAVLRITPIGMSPTFTQDDSCFLMPLQSGGDYEAYGELDRSGRTLRLSINNHEVLFPINADRGRLARSAVGRGYTVRLTPVTLHSMRQTITLTISRGRTIASRSFRFECNG